MMNDTLRSAIAADLTPVRPLASPTWRALSVVPLALVLLGAAPVVFEFRDLTTLGWMWSWGASIAQMAVGVAAIALSLRDAVPGRGWSARALVPAIGAVLVLLLIVTMGAWSVSPVTLPRYWWQIGAMCAVGSATSALPAVVLSALLIVRAYPVRPALTGAIGGLGAGVLADSGWRLFCHYSEPSHVIAAHLGAIGVAALFGSIFTSWLVHAGRHSGYPPIGYTHGWGRDG